MLDLINDVKVDTRHEAIRINDTTLRSWLRLDEGSVVIDTLKSMKNHLEGKTNHMDEYLKWDMRSEYTREEYIKEFGEYKWEDSRDVKIERGILEEYVEMHEKDLENDTSHCGDLICCIVGNVNAGVKGIVVNEELNSMMKRESNIIKA